MNDLTGTLSKDEETYMLRRMEPEHPDISFDSLAFERKIDEGLTELLYGLPSDEFRECLSEMSDVDLSELREQMKKHRQTGRDVAAEDLGRFIDRMFEKYFRDRVIAAIESGGE